MKKLLFVVCLIIAGAIAYKVSTTPPAPESTEPIIVKREPEPPTAVADDKGVAVLGDFRVTFLQGGVTADSAVVFLKVENTNPKTRPNFDSWGNTRLFESNAEAYDDLGNRYDAIEIPGQRSGELMADQPADVVASFRRPVPAAKFLTIHLPAERMDEKGQFVFSMTLAEKGKAVKPANPRPASSRRAGRK